MLFPPSRVAIADSRPRVAVRSLARLSHLRAGAQEVPSVRLSSEAREVEERKVFEVGRKLPFQVRVRHSKIPRIGYRGALSRRLHEVVTSSTLHSAVTRVSAVAYVPCSPKKKV